MPFFPDHIAYGKHRGHTYTAERYEDDPDNQLIRCSCDKEWTVAFDPTGELGSEEAPVG